MYFASMQKIFAIAHTSIIIICIKDVIDLNLSPLPEEEYPLPGRSSCLYVIQKTLYRLPRWEAEDGRGLRRANISRWQPNKRSSDLNLVDIIRTHADHCHYAETKYNQLRNITFAKIRILIEKYSTEHDSARRYRYFLQCHDAFRFTEQTNRLVTLSSHYMCHYLWLHDDSLLSPCQFVGRKRTESASMQTRTPTLIYK